MTFLLVARWAAGLLSRTGVRPLILAGSGCLITGFGRLTHAQVHGSYLGDVLGPTLLIAVGIGLTFPTLMAAATAGAPEQDAGIVGALATTTNQVGAAVGLAVLATAAGTRATTTRGAPPAAALAAGCYLVFLIAAGLSLTIAVVTTLLPKRRPD